MPERFVKSFLLFLFSVGFISCSLDKHSISDIVAISNDEILKIKYGNVAAEHGNELTPSQVKEAPVVEWPVSAKNYYTLFMIDPDAPSHEKPVAKHWLHWLVGNIPGIDIAKGETLAEYIGAGPPKGTGVHRYVFLLYKQPSKIEFNEPHLKNTSGAGRGKFSFEKFIEKYNIQQFVSGNHYVAEWDSYVPLLQKQLSGK